MIQGAIGYEIEFSALKEGSNKSSKQFKTNSNSWDGKLEPGEYQIKLRSLDHRKVPGEWSSNQKFIVWLDDVIIKKPKDEEMHFKTDKNAKIEIAWNKVEGAEKYFLEVYSDNKQIFEKLTDQTFEEVSLPVGKEYKIQVLAISSKSKSENQSFKSIRIFGKILEKPEVNRIENEFVREINWNKGNQSYKSNWALDYNRNSQWYRVEQQKGFAKEKINFKPEYSGGKYRFSVQSTQELFDPSDFVTLEFDVFNGDRSAASEYMHELRGSIEQLNGWSLKSSYMITMVDYKSSFIQGNYLANVALNPLGGTLRGGISYKRPNQSFGYDFYGDASGYLIENTSYSYFAAEGNRTWSTNLSDVMDVLVQYGLAIKEVPQILKYTDQTQHVEKILLLAPHVGAEIWRAMSPKYGLQMNMHFQFNYLKLKSNYGGELIPTMTNQVGILGSYSFRKNIKLFLGYTYRSETVQLSSGKIKPYDVESVGHYLSTGLNWLL